MLPKVAGILVILLLFLAGCSPEAQEVSGNKNIEGNEAGGRKVEIKQVNGIPIDDAAAVVKEMIADVYSEPNVRSRRITQVIYNQAVRIISKEGSWSMIEAHDGSTGWIRSKYIDSNTGSISGRSYTHRIVVTTKEKEVFSSPTGGITLKNAVMGSVFYAFNNSDNAYEVYLPGNMTGWLRGSGFIHIDLEGDIPLTSGADFAASAQKLKGVSYLDNGLSLMGMDSKGMIYICARINGLDAPRSMEELARFGDEVALEELLMGDIVFLGGDDNNITDAGIYLGNGQYIHSSRTAGYVRLVGLNESSSDGKPLFARRIFR